MGITYSRDIDIEPAVDPIEIVEDPIEIEPLEYDEVQETFDWYFSWI